MNLHNKLKNERLSFAFLYYPSFVELAIPLNFHKGRIKSPDYKGSQALAVSPRVLHPLTRLSRDLLKTPTQSALTPCSEQSAVRPEPPEPVLQISRPIWPVCITGSNRAFKDLDTSYLVSTTGLNRDENTVVVYLRKKFNYFVFHFKTEEVYSVLIYLLVLGAEKISAVQSLLISPSRPKRALLNIIIIHGL